MAEFAVAQHEAGAAAVQVFDSWAGSLAPADYERYVMPHTRAIFARMEEAGVPGINFATGNPELLPLIAATLIAVLLAFGAFALPVLRAPDYVPIGAFGLRVGSFGLLVALLTVVIAALVALKARPGRGAALLLGAAVVTAVRAWEYPLTAARAAEAAPGPGLWLAAAATAGVTDCAEFTCV